VSLRRPHVVLGALLVLAALIAATSATGVIGAATSPSSTASATSTKAGPKAPRPNVVMIVLDDFSVDLTQTLRTARWFRRNGATYANAFVVDSLCCVSRASTFTGQYPHQTGVLTNTADPYRPRDPQGGFGAYRYFGNEQRSMAVSLQRSGVHTAYVGKFLNQYENRNGVLPPRQPGWTDQRVIFGSAYDGWGFASTYLSGGNLRAQEHPLPSPYASAAEKDKLYAGTVTSDLAMGAIGRARSPYFVQIAPYAPHSRVGPVGAFANEPVFPAAFGDRPSAARPMGNCGAVRCGALTVRDLRGFGDDQRNNQPRYRDGTLAPHWNPPPGGLGVRTALTFMRDRARMAQSADRMIQRVLNTVDLRRTYVVLTSDNGFHLGQNGMGAGKGSAYDTDIRVPLMVAGPGVRPGVRDGVVSNIDLAATVEDLMGVRTPAYRSGVSFAASLRNPKAATTDFAFVEHTWARVVAGDPDRPTWEAAYELRPGGRSEMDSIPSYVAVRGRDELLLRVNLASIGASGGPGRQFVYEYYDLARDGGFEKVNRFGSKRYRERVADLMSRLRTFDSCRSVRRSSAVPARCRASRIR
jgi:N-acetylglucosamine-6-sulfatase